MALQAGVFDFFENDTENDNYEKSLKSHTIKKSVLAVNVNEKQLHNSNLANSCFVVILSVNLSAKSGN